MPPGQPLTVEASRTRSRLLHPDIPARTLGPTANVRVLWTRELRDQLHAFSVVPVNDCLVQCIRTLRPSWAVAVLDSALRHTSLTEFDLAELAIRVPRRLQALIGLADARAESGTESVLRVELQRAGIAAAIQVPIPFSPLERFDLVVGDRLVIECDSAEFHGSAADRERDLRRDALAAGFGFVVLRFGYPQIMFDIDGVLAVIQRYIDLGLHESPRPHAVQG
jgi:very-short-patch-repair endonuclease